MLNFPLIQGRFEILSLSGSFLLFDNVGQCSRTDGFSVSVVGLDGHVLGGGLAGMLTTTFLIQDYKCTVEFYVHESKGRVKQRCVPTLRLDAVDRGSSRWRGANILAFNTAHWWSHFKIKYGMDNANRGAAMPLSRQDGSTYDARLRRTTPGTERTMSPIEPDTITQLKAHWVHSWSISFIAYKRKILHMAMSTSKFIVRFIIFNHFYRRLRNIAIS
ncbi:hypothetical protein Syun_012163 [Stephania yunnanensis]|uniref:AT-hook motif nuclear-localized protein n=1 Tax=Stephania yunnanensis TaxID=152371 RepID=A0AAP0PF21_9MAGN